MLAQHLQGSFGVFRPRSAQRSAYQLPPTERQVEALRAYLETGSHAAAASVLGVSERTVKNHLAALRERLNVQTTAQSVYVLWLGYRDHVAECGQATHDDCLPEIEEIAAYS